MNLKKAQLMVVLAVTFYMQGAMPVWAEGTLAKLGRAPAIMGLRTGISYGTFVAKAEADGFPVEGAFGHTNIWLGPRLADGNEVRVGTRFLSHKKEHHKEWTDVIAFSQFSSASGPVPASAPVRSIFFLRTFGNKPASWPKALDIEAFIKRKFGSTPNCVLQHGAKIIYLYDTVWHQLHAAGHQCQEQATFDADRANELYHGLKDGKFIAAHYVDAQVDRAIDGHTQDFSITMKDMRAIAAEEDSHVQAAQARLKAHPEIPAANGL